VHRFLIAASDKKHRVAGLSSHKKHHKRNLGTLERLVKTSGVCVAKPTKTKSDLEQGGTADQYCHLVNHFTRDST